MGMSHNPKEWGNDEEEEGGRKGESVTQRKDGKDKKGWCCLTVNVSMLIAVMLQLRVLEDVQLTARDAKREILLRQTQRLLILFAVLILTDLEQIAWVSEWTARMQLKSRGG